jgi:Rrf2 family cysteine metabolism transcriptional repressor
MKLPTKVRYAVRAVVELAGRETEDPVPVSSLAKAQGISSKYGKQLLNRLKRAGIVKGYPGVHGGYTLNREPDHISLYDIYNALEESFDLAPCVKPRSGCKREDICTAKSVWVELRHLLEKELRSITIEDLVKH